MTRVLVSVVVIVLMAAGLGHAVAGPMPVGLIASGSGNLLLCRHGTIMKFKQHKDNPTQGQKPAKSQ
jgi:hypothetical protein